MEVQALVRSRLNRLLFFEPKLIFNRGCVTPYQFEQWKDITGGDMDMVDGFDELPPDAQEMVQRCIEQGHVDDEDWKGVGEIQYAKFSDPSNKNVQDPSMNRDGKKKMRMSQKDKKDLEKKKEVCRFVQTGRQT